MSTAAKLAPTKTPKSVAELYQEREDLRDQAQALYEKADDVTLKLVRAWRKDKTAIVHTASHKKTGEELHYRLEIEDTFRRGQMKSFTPAFAHRYKLTLKSANDDND